MVAGDDSAWLRFHERYGPQLFRMLLSMTRGDAHLSSDAMQHAYLRIARYVKVCDTAPAWHAWLRLVARSALRDCQRREFRFRDLLRRHEKEPDTVSPGSETAKEGRLFDRLDEAMAELSPQVRDLLERKYYKRQSIRSIAKELGLSDKAVESRLTRARADLKNCLNLALARIHHE